MEVPRAKRMYDGSDIKNALMLYHAHKSFRKAAMLCDPSKSTIQRWWSAVGRVNRHIKKHRKAQVGRYKWCLHIVREIVGQNGFMTLQEILLKVRATDVSLNAMSVSSLGRMMKELKFKRKRLSTHVTYCKPDALKAKVSAFQERIRDIPLDEIISIDETGFGTHANTFYRYTLGPSDDKVEVPTRKKRSCVMAVTTTGLSFDNYHQVQRDAYGTGSFLTFIERLMMSIPDTIKYVVMDNINFHHSKSVVSTIEDYGREVIFTPPYSPRFNPIECVFSVIKRLFRKNYLETKDLDLSISRAIALYKVSHNDLTATFEHCIRCQI